MPEPVVDTLAALFRTRSALLVDLDDGHGDDGTGERLLVLSNLSGTFQLCELVEGTLTELTRLPEPVSTAAYLPAGGPVGGRRAILAADAGGNERAQLYLIDLEAAATTPVTAFDQLDPLTADPDHRHEYAGVSDDGTLIAYASNRANGVDHDLWLIDLASREHRLLYAGASWCEPAGGFSPDGRWLATLRAGDRPLDNDLVLVDVHTGEARIPLPHPEEAALLGPPVWTGPDRFLTTSNVGRDFTAVVEVDLTSGTSRVWPGTGVDADTEAILGRAGTLLIVENRHCATPIRRLDPDGPGAEIPVPEAGVCASYALPTPRLSGDGRRLLFTLTAPRQNAEVFCHDLDAGTTTRLTHSPAEVDPATLAGVELHTIASFDGEPVELFLLRPDDPGGEAAPPVVVLVHGGPESQSQLGFNPICQALVTAGFGVVVPNVRGSTGYGRRFAALDDTVRRLDSVADLAAIHDALPGLGFDRDRAALWGGSYGGYMVLAGVSMQPERWAAGVDIVGISNLVTFLENTSAYRRRFREVEYGSLEHDHDFLVTASPMTYADRIRAPLFIIHGANDPRVPLSEAEQLHAGLRARGVESELLVYADEGHGLGRLVNRLDAYPRAIAFLRRHLASV